MKKIIACVVIITVLAAASCTACANYNGLYPKFSVVVNVDYNNDIVTVKDFNGFLWEFFGCEDWIENDICSLLMFDNNTSDTIFDDIIVDVRYDGWVE